MWNANVNCTSTQNLQIVSLIEMFMFRRLLSIARGVDGCTDRYAASSSVI